MSHGLKIGHRIFLEQFDKDLISQDDSGCVQNEFKGVKNYLTCCVHIDGVSI